MADNKKKPIMKSRHGRFQVSVFSKERMIAPEEHEIGYVPERKVPYHYLTCVTTKFWASERSDDSLDFRTISQTQPNL